MDKFDGFCLSTRLAILAKDWTDWSETGLHNLADVICSSIVLRLMASQQYRARLGRPPRSPEFVLWAVNWLSVR